MSRFHFLSLSPSPPPQILFLPFHLHFLPRLTPPSLPPHPSSILLILSLFLCFRFSIPVLVFPSFFLSYSLPVSSSFLYPDVFFFLFLIYSIPVSFGFFYLFILSLFLHVFSVPVSSRFFFVSSCFFLFIFHFLVPQFLFLRLLSPPPFFFSLFNIYLFS